MEKNKWVLEISVDSDSVSSFLNKFYTEKTPDKILSFVKKSLLEHHIEVNSKFENDFSEIIANAYDAFAQTGIKKDNNFLLQVVVKEKNNKTIVNIMDNGIGFANHPKRIYFQKSQIEKHQKDPNVYIGGMNVGLYIFENTCLKNNASLFFKNRKNGGATVSIQFNHDKPLRIKKTKTKPEKPKVILTIDKITEIANFISQLWINKILGFIQFCLPNQINLFTECAPDNNLMLIKKIEGSLYHENNLLYSIEHNEFTKNHLLRFRAELTNLVLEELKKYRTISLSTDYAPEGILAKAWKQAKMPNLYYLIPELAYMHCSLDNMHINYRDGYNGNEEIDIPVNVDSLQHGVDEKCLSLTSRI